MKKFIFYLFNSFILSLFLLVKWIHFIFNGNIHRFTVEELALSNILIFILMFLLLVNIYFAYKEAKK